MRVNPDMSKYDYLLENNKNYMNYTALTSSLSNRKITYEEMHDRIEKYARILYKKGIRQGDIIGVCALNTPESVYLLYALDIIGAIVVGYSPLDNKEKIKRDIEMTKPKMIITVDMMYSNFKDYEKALNFSTVLYSLMESCDNLKMKMGYEALQKTKGNFKLAPSSNLHHLLKDDSKIDYQKATYQKRGLTDIVFTGGSTGVRKGVDLAGDGLNYVVDGMNDLFKAEPGMVHLGNIPIGHMVFGRYNLHVALCNNMEFALTLDASVENFYDELVRTHSEVAVGGPPHWVSLIEKDGDKFVPSKRLKKGSLKNLIYATSGGEAKKATTVEAINQALEYCGSSAKLGDGFGATETWATIAANNGRRNTPGTIGNANSNLKIKLVDPDTLEEVKKGEKGLLYVSGPAVMLGYHNNQAETDKVISYDASGERWCNLGDFLQETETGEYKYVGRQKRNFVSGIENIYPEQIEELLTTLPEVREVVVTPVSDEIRQFIPYYHISVYDENIDFEEFEKKLNKLVISKLSENWLPGYIEYTKEPLVRMANSKINVTYYQNKDITENQDEMKNKKVKVLKKNF